MVDDILKKYPNDVKVVFKSFPLGSHKQAFKAAKYATAAGRQGKFKEMFLKIFENDNWRGLKNNEDLPKTYAAELGLDIGQLEKDMNDPALEAQINAEYNQLKALGNSYDTEQYAGVRLAVPKFFINGREPAGRTLEAWSKVIEEELKEYGTINGKIQYDGKNDLIIVPIKYTKDSETIETVFKSIGYQYKNIINSLDNKMTYPFEIALPIDDKENYINYFNILSYENINHVSEEYFSGTLEPLQLAAKFNIYDNTLSIRANWINTVNFEFK